MNEDSPDGWVKDWIKNSRPSKHAKRKGKIMLNWLFSSLNFLEEDRVNDSIENMSDEQMKEEITKFVCDWFIVIVITLEKGQLKKIRDWIDASPKVQKPKTNPSAEIPPEREPS